MSTTKTAYDVFKAWLVEGAQFDGEYEFPIIGDSGKFQKESSHLIKQSGIKIMTNGCIFISMTGNLNGFGIIPTNILRYSSDMKGLLRLISAFTAICLFPCRFGIHTATEQLVTG